MSADRNTERPSDPWPRADRLVDSLENRSSQADVRPEVESALEARLLANEPTLGRDLSMAPKRSLGPRLVLVAACLAMMVGAGAVGLRLASSGQDDLTTTSPSTALSTPTTKVVHPVVDCESGSAGLGSFELPESGLTVGQVAVGDAPSSRRPLFVSVAVAGSWQAVEQGQHLQDADLPFGATIAYLGLPENFDSASMLAAVAEVVDSSCTSAQFIIATGGLPASLLANTMCSDNLARAGLTGVVIVGDFDPPDCRPNTSATVLIPLGSDAGPRWAEAFGCTLAEVDEQIQQPSACDRTLTVAQATTNDPWASSYDGQTVADLVLSIASSG